MENASKALIIAGAILLSILLISLGIIIYSQGSEAVKKSGMEDMNISSFNKKFTDYEGDKVKGSKVNALLQEVIASNVNPENTDRKITVIDSSSSNKVSISGYTQITNSADTSKTYKVKCSYDATTALVNKITIQRN